MHNRYIEPQLRRIEAAAALGQKPDPEFYLDNRTYRLDDFLNELRAEYPERIAAIRDKLAVLDKPQVVKADGPTDPFASYVDPALEDRVGLAAAFFAARIARTLRIGGALPGRVGCNGLFVALDVALMALSSDRSPAPQAAGLLGLDPGASVGACAGRLLWQLRDRGLFAKPADQAAPAIKTDVGASLERFQDRVARSKARAAF